VNTNRFDASSTKELMCGFSCLQSGDFFEP
jgi:hypothetical protein